MAGSSNGSQSVVMEPAWRPMIQDLSSIDGLHVRLRGSRSLGLFPGMMGHESCMTFDTARELRSFPSLALLRWRPDHALFW